VRTRRLVHPAIAALVVLAVAGCSGGGESAKPAAQILTDAQAAANSADSVHISGTVAQGAGTAPGAATATIDLVLTSSGDGREQITGAGQNLEVIKVGQVIYVKGLKAPGATGGYQQLPASDPRAASLVAQLDKKSVFEQIVKTGSAPTISGTETVGGQAAVKITPGGGVGVLYVADDAAHPYPLKVETTPAGGTAGGPTGALVFTDWNAHAVITAPPNGGN